VSESIIQSISQSISRKVTTNTKWPAVVYNRLATAMQYARLTLSWCVSVVGVELPRRRHVTALCSSAAEHLPYLLRT